MGESGGGEEGEKDAKWPMSILAAGVTVCAAKAERESVYLVFILHFIIRLL